MDKGEAKLDYIKWQKKVIEEIKKIRDVRLLRIIYLFILGLHK